MQSDLWQKKTICFTTFAWSESDDAIFKLLLWWSFVHACFFACCLRPFFPSRARWWVAMVVAAAMSGTRLIVAAPSCFPTCLHHHRRLLCCHSTLQLLAPSTIRWNFKFFVPIVWRFSQSSLVFLLLLCLISSQASLKLHEYWYLLRTKVIWKNFSSSRLL